MGYAAAIQAATTLVLGGFAAFIAWRQWRTSRDRLVIDLFERRFQVFQELTRTISDAFNKANVAISDLANFDGATEKARYLFGPEVHTYLRQIRAKLIEIHAIEAALAQLPNGAARTLAENKVSDALGDMHLFYGTLAEMLTAYLRIAMQSQPKRNAPMNLRRGLFRVWLALSVMWFAWCFWQNDYSCFYVGEPGPWCDYWTAATYLKAIGIFFGAPLLILALGISGEWIRRGFKSS